MNLNISPSPFPLDEIREDHDHSHDLHPFGPNYFVVPSSTSGSQNFLFDSTQDHTGYYHQQPYQAQHRQEGDNNYGYNHNGPSSYEIKNEVESSGLKLTLWKKEADHDHHGEEMKSTNIPEKWMSSKMRVMQKMKSTTPDRVVPNIITSNATTNIDHEDHNLKQSFSMDSSTSSYINNSPIRVCADCNTTKTPLWRSGPRGPKSLCNACGIRQRKARRALAAANGTASTQPPTALKIKVQHKEKKIGKNAHASHLKKRCKMVVSASNSTSDGSTSNGQKKLGFEDFLINLSKNLAFHRVFPEDERDAAILLMAISSGLVHG